MNAADELTGIIQREYIRAINRKRPSDAFTAPADAILAAGYRKPRTITDHYAEGGTDSLCGGTVILSDGDALLAQSDGTFCDPTGSTWDFWELELPITVLYEPGGAA